MSAPGRSQLAPILRQKCEALGLAVGTYPENLAAYRLARAGQTFAQQHRVGRYRLDIAWPAHRLALEIDGPHHHRPDVAHRDALRDAWLRDQGWIVLRVNDGPTFEEQLVRVARLVHTVTAWGEPL